MSRRSASEAAALTVACAAVLLAGCGEASEPEPQGPPLLPGEGGFLYWVDAARCLTPCTGDPSLHLVTVGVDGAIDPLGALWFEAAAQPALMQFIEAGKAAGHSLGVGSPFRSYQTQLELWINATEIGRTARPGHSEHQIGTAVDLAFQTAEAEHWLADHAHEYGFALSFPRGTEKQTGIRFESWHYRYVGLEAAAEAFAQGWSVAQYLRAHPEIARFGDCSDCPSPESWQDCGALDAAGICEADVLRWCLDGAAAAVDCTTTGLTCSVVDGEANCR